MDFCKFNDINEFIDFNTLLTFFLDESADDLRTRREMADVF